MLKNVDSSVEHISQSTTPPLCVGCSRLCSKQEMFDSMPVHCWPTVCNAGPTLKQLCVNIWCWMGKYKRLKQWWGNVGPPSTPLAQHYTSIGSTSVICWSISDIHSHLVMLSVILPPLRHTESPGGLVLHDARWLSAEDSASEQSGGQENQQCERRSLRPVDRSHTLWTAVISLSMCNSD